MAGIGAPARPSTFLKAPNFGLCYTNGMKRLYLAITAGIMISVLCPNGSFVFSAGLVSDHPGGDASVETVLVKYRGETAPREYPITGSLSKTLSRLSLDPRVEYAEPNYIYEAAFMPSDSYVTNQWYLRKIKAPEAWSVRAISPRAVIAIIDSGVQITHSDLRDNIWVNDAEIEGNKKDDDNNGLIDDRFGWDFVNNVADPSPKFAPGFTEGGIMHGTIIAGLAAAAGNNNYGIAGITWETQIMALKALDDKGSGDTAAVIKAIDYAVAKGANVINLSFIGYGYSRGLKDAITRAYNAGVIVVAPAGNDLAGGHGMNLNDRPVYPACFRGNHDERIVVGVAATDQLDQKTSFSGYGDRCIDIAAPGMSFFSTTVKAPAKSAGGKFFNQEYGGYWSGTSFPVALVSGAIALIQGANPTLAPEQAVDMLLRNADNIDFINPEYAGQLGHGRLNIGSSVSEADHQLSRYEAKIATAIGSAGSPVIRVNDTQGATEFRFLAYPENFQGGVNIAAADINGDGSDEIITAPASGRESDIRIFDRNGRMLSHFLAYPASFRGGVNLAVGDIDGDGTIEIITAPERGMKSEIKIFSANGKRKQSFLAYPASFMGGVSIAVGNVVDGADPEIVTAPGVGGVPEVRVFSSEGRKISSFVTDPSRKPVGLRVALAELDGNARRLHNEIIVSRRSGPPIISFFDFRGNLRKNWAAYSSPYAGDVKVSVADIDRDGYSEIMTAPGSGAAPHVRIFDRTGTIIRSFYMFPTTFSGGLSVTGLLVKPNP